MLPLFLVTAALASAKPVTFISAEPTYTVCNESLLTWADGAPPYAVKAKIGPDDDRKFRTIQQHLNTTTYRFFVDLPAGTDLELWIQDSSGEQEAIPGDASIRQFVRANPGHTCPLYLFPGQTTNATQTAPVTTTKTVLSTVFPSETASSDSAQSSEEQKSKSSNTGQIVGGVIGGVLGATIVAGLLFWIWRLKKQAKKQPYNEIEYEDQSSTANVRQAGASQPTIATTAGLSGAGAAAGVAGGSSGPSAAGGSVSASQHATLVRGDVPDPSPEIKVMQLDAMLSPNSPQRTPSDSPSPGYFPHPGQAGTPGTPQGNGLAGFAGLVPPQHFGENESEYEVDAGPAFAPQPQPRTVHPPQYRDVGKI